MLLISLLSAGLAALGFYLASPHQRLWPRAAAHVRRLRQAAWAGCIGAPAACAVVLGVWAGFFAALSAFMLVLVALPYLDAYRRSRHVG